MGTSEAIKSEGRRCVVTAIGDNDEPAAVKEFEETQVTPMTSFVSTSEPSRNHNATFLPPLMPSSFYFLLNQVSIQQPLHLLLNLPLRCQIFNLLDKVSISPLYLLLNQTSIQVLFPLLCLLLFHLLYHFNFLFYAWSESLTFS